MRIRKGQRHIIHFFGTCLPTAKMILGRLEIFKKILLEKLSQFLIIWKNSYGNRMKDSFRFATETDIVKHNISVTFNETSGHVKYDIQVDTLDHIHIWLTFTTHLQITLHTKTYQTSHKSESII